jgi:FtsP/CotA-like multicopper oxidase with cupredoxin domain
VSDPLAALKAGDSVVLTLENDATTRTLMLEGQTARLLDALDDGWKPWWQDVFMIDPDTTIRIAFVPQETGRYALDLVPLEGHGAPTRAYIDVT